MEGSIRRVYLNAYDSIEKHIRMKTTSSVETAALNHKGHERQFRMKLLSAIILTILLFRNPARAEVNPIILERFLKWEEANRSKWLQVTTYDSAKHAFVVTVAEYNNDFAAMAVETVKTVRGAKVPWMIWSPSGSFLYIEGEPPIPVASPRDLQSEAPE